MNRVPEHDSTTFFMLHRTKCKPMHLECSDITLTLTLNPNPKPCEVNIVQRQQTQHVADSMEDPALIIIIIIIIIIIR